jgi:hypothetical protein
MSHVRLDYIPEVSNSVVNGHATHVQLDYIPVVSHSVVNDHATLLKILNSPSFATRCIVSLLKDMVYESKPFRSL